MPRRGFGPYSAAMVDRVFLSGPMGSGKSRVARALGELWRTAEFHNENWYNVPMFFGTVEVHNDLQSGRYIAMGLRSEEKLIFEPIKRTPGDYTPSNLRGIGTR